MPAVGLKTFIIFFCCFIVYKKFNKHPNAFYTNTLLACFLSYLDQKKIWLINL